jgi:hypothetical protein
MDPAHAAYLPLNHQLGFPGCADIESSLASLSDPPRWAVVMVLKARLPAHACAIWKHQLMKSALQRWLWLGMLLPARAAFATEAEHGLPRNAVKIDHWGSFMTNSMVVSWVVVTALIIFARVATRDIKGVSWRGSKAQNLLEWLVEGLYGLLESIIGPHLVKRTTKLSTKLRNSSAAQQPGWDASRLDRRYSW